MIQPEEIDAFLLPLPVGRLPGVGKVTEEKLTKLGIKTVGELRGRWIWPSLKLNLVVTVCASTNSRVASTRTKSYRTDPQSPSRLRTPFKQDVLLAETEPMIRRLVEKLWSASRNETRVAHTVVLKLKTSEFKILTRSHTPNIAPSSCDEVMAIALGLRERVDLGPQQRYRLVGIGLSNFREPEVAPAQPVLFE